jgi:glycosyltransferase involved in cell wall biosynthesis
MNTKVKILWFSNVIFTDSKSNSTGTWIHSMASEVVKTGKIDLYHISQANVKKTTRQDFQIVNQWLIPDKPLKKGLPSTKIISDIVEIVEYIKPDLIHIWGTENFWGLLTARGYIRGNVILEIQGLKFIWEKYFYSGLSFKDIFKCFGIKELLKPSVSLIGLHYSFKKWGKFEKEMLHKHNIISTQSEWVRANIKDIISPTTKVLNTAILLRPEFFNAKKWDIQNCIPFQIFTSTSINFSYKGLHVLIDAIGVLKNQFPQIMLKIAGTIPNGIRQGGYFKWIKRKIRLLGIDNNVNWLGALDATEIVKELHKANVVVIPSYIESYCLALDEALRIGVPTVISFAGAMPELASHGKTALFFPPGDAIMCASYIRLLFLNKEYAIAISKKAINEKEQINMEGITNLQLKLYYDILSSEKL